MQVKKQQLEMCMEKDRFQIGKGVRQGCLLSPCLFNFYAESIMRNAGLDEAQAGIKIARKSINNLRYADDTTLMTESKEELESLLMKVPFHTIHGVFKVRILKWFGIPFAHHFMANRWGNSGNSDTLFFRAPKSVQMVTATMKLKDAYSLEEKLRPTDSFEKTLMLGNIEVGEGDNRG